MAQLSAAAARASAMRWIVSAMLVACFAGWCNAKVTIDWCVQPTVGGSAVSNPLVVGCGEEVEFVWCSSSRHDLVELVPGGDCSTVMSGASDDVALSGPGTKKTVKLTTTGRRVFKCTPHCEAGMHVDLATTCGASTPALGPKPAGPKPSGSGSKGEAPKPPKLVVDWCFQPAVNGTKATGPVPVPCGTSVDFVWCSQSMHNLIELKPAGTCDDVLAGAKDNVPDISGPGTTKTIVLDAPGVRHFKCAPHCGGGMQITFDVTCPPAGKAPSKSPTGTRTKSPAPAKKPSGPTKSPKRW